MKKGSHHTQQAKDKISEKRKGRKHSKETRLKMSQSHKKEWHWYHYDDIEIRVLEGSYVPLGFRRGRAPRPEQP